MAVTLKSANTFSVKSKILLLILLIALVMILHYPMSFNEIGWDSFAIHILANSISEFGYAKWWLHPLSVVGMYPYGGVGGALLFLLSGTSQITEMSGDVNIFWVSLFLGILSIFTAYLMAGAIFDHDMYKFLVAFGYSTCQGILFYTTWTAGTRAFFIILLPLFIYALIKSFERIKYVPLTLILFLLLVSTHKLYYFLIPVIFSFALVHIIYKLKFHISSKKYNSFNLVFLFGFLFTFSIPFFTRTFIEIGSRYEWLFHLIITYIRYNGIAILFIVSGYIYVLLDNNKSKGEYMLLTSLIFLAPFMYIVRYMKWFILPFLFLFAGKGLWNILKAKSTYRVVPLIIICIIIFSAFFQYINFYTDSSSTERYLNEPLYVTATWSREYISHSSNMIGLYGATGERFFAISEIPTMTGSDTVDFTYGFVNKSKINITRIPLTSFDAYFESPFVSTIGGATTDWFFGNMFIYDTIDEKGTRNIIDSYNLSYLVENIKTGRTKFLSSIYEKKECYYDNGQIRVWYLKSS